MIVEITYTGINPLAELTVLGSQLVELTFLTTNTVISGGGGGTQNVFIQQTQPTLDQNLLWVELNNDNSIKTFWVNTL